MERRGLKLRKGLLKRVLPLMRLMPPTAASRVLTRMGTLEYRLHQPMRRAFQDAVAEGSRTLNCEWDVSQTSRELAANQILWRTRDMLLDGLSDEEANAMFRVTGKEHLDAATAQGKGCIVLTSHFGAHMLPAHWLYRNDYPVKLYMEKPRSISRYMTAKFDTEGPLSQDKLFISRKGESTDAAGSILRAARVIKSGNHLFIAGDVRWSGQMTEEAVFLGQTLRFSTTWVVLAAMTSAPVVSVYCRIGDDRRFEVDFQPAFQVPRSGQQPGGATEWVQRFLDQLQDQIRRHPENSNDYLFWKDQDGEAA